MFQSGNRRPLAVSANPEIREMMKHQREKMKEERERLSNSLTNPIVRGGLEEKVFEDDSWYKKEKDNLNKKFSTLPPIQDGKLIKDQAVAFVV